MNMSPLRYALLLTISLALQACGLSPQVIEIHPTPVVNAENLGQNQPVDITVTDARSKTEFGSRGGVYEETSLIRPANDITKAIDESLTRSLQTMGFNAYNPGSDSTRVEIIIHKLNYQPEEGRSIITKVSVDTYLQAVASKGETTHKGVYRTKSTYEQPITPTAKRNETILNEAINKTLERFLKDEKMLAFMSGQTVSADTLEKQAENNDSTENADDQQAQSNQ